MAAQELHEAIYELAYNDFIQIMNRSYSLNETIEAFNQYYKQYYKQYINQILLDSSSSYLYYAEIILTCQLVVGIIGNIVSLIVWTKGKECSKLACSMYFQLLAICDIFALICARWGVTVTKKSTYEYNRAVVAIFDFLIYFSSQLSTWLIVCISYERFFSITFPFSFSPNGAKCRAKIAFVVLILVMTAVNGYAFLPCYANLRCLSFWPNLSNIWIQIVVPFILIVTSNILILVPMCCLNRNSNIISREQHSMRFAVFTKLTLSSSLLLLISMFPALIWYMEISYHIFHLSLKEERLLGTISISTLFANNCFNFLVYCFSSRTFRSDIKHFMHTIKNCSRNDTIVTVA